VVVQFRRQMPLEFEMQLQPEGQSPFALHARVQRPPG